MKKITSFLLVISLFLLLLQITAYADAVPTIQVGTASANGGETVSVPVVFLNNPGINVYRVSIDYDTQRLHLDSVTSNEAVGGEFAYVQKAVWFSMNDTAFSGEFFTLNFTVPENAPTGEAYISVSYEKGDICNRREEDIYFSVTDGSVTVNNDFSDTPVIKVGTATANPGKKVSVPVEFLNNPGISAFCMAFDYDTTVLQLENVTANKNIGGDFLYVKKAVWIGADTTFSGEFFTLDFIVLDNAKIGDTTVSVSYGNQDICNRDGDEIHFLAVPGTVTVVTAPVCGDGNGDGVIDAKDLIVLRKALLANTEYSEVLDANGDGAVDLCDLVRIKKHFADNTVLLGR